VNAALQGLEPAPLISVGFCGALDPAFNVGDIFEPTQEQIHSEDRVIVTAADKRSIQQTTGARVCEMEYAAVFAQALRWGVTCRAVKVVSDTAHEDLPLDLNRYRSSDGHFQLTRIALAGLLRPFTVLPRLMQLDRNSRIAAERLGEFLVHYKF
jgi:adenosylhomocysteine nucleosidase